MKPARGQMAHSTYAVIMAGGSGTRFWPASRRQCPKQLLALAADAPLIRQAVDRVAAVCGEEHVYVSTGSHLVEATRAALGGFPLDRMLVEPTARNTAPAVGWAAATIARRDPEAVIVAMPADPHIGDDERFRACLRAAVAEARSGRVTTIGIQPTHAETGYGYLKVAATRRRRGDVEVVDVDRFVEKPDQATAERFLAGGEHLFNAGMFFFRAVDMLDAIERHLPALAAGLRRLDAAAARGEEAACLPEVFAELPAVSIDTGVMEHLTGLSAVVGDFGWSDIGGWRAAAELAAGRIPAPGTEHVWVDAADNHVVDLRTDRSEGRRAIALVGVSRLVVVVTDDAILVADRDHAQDVRAVVDELRARGRSDLT